VSLASRENSLAYLGRKVLPIFKGLAYLVKIIQILAEKKKRFLKID